MIKAKLSNWIRLLKRNRYIKEIPWTIVGLVVFYCIFALIYYTYIVIKWARGATISHSAIWDPPLYAFGIIMSPLLALGIIYFLFLSTFLWIGLICLFLSGAIRGGIAKVKEAFRDPTMFGETEDDRIIFILLTVISGLFFLGYGIYYFLFR